MYHYHHLILSTKQEEELFKMGLSVIKYYKALFSRPLLLPCSLSNI